MKAEDYGVSSCPICGAWMVPPYNHKAGCSRAARANYAPHPPRLVRGILVGLALELLVLAAAYVLWRTFR